jgi:hypothetical protein
MKIAKAVSSEVGAVRVKKTRQNGSRAQLAPSASVPI